MNAVKIGVLDKEMSYVERLSTYLNHYGNSIWNVSAFTDNKILMRYMEDRRIDLLLSTNIEIIEDMQRKYPDRIYVFLSGEDVETGKFNEQKPFVLYRYQSANAIGGTIKDIVDYKGLLVNKNKVSAIIYSPVGRCGKTMLAKRFVSELSCDKWLYVGMEDFGGVEPDSNNGDDFLYYLKERRDNEVKNMIENCDGYISSPFSLLDIRGIDRDDVDWFLKLFETESMYRGVVFDMGSAIMGNYEIMFEFDHIIIPFLNSPVSMDKRRQFEKLIDAYELTELKERMYYIDMDNGSSCEDEMLRLLE